MGEIPDPPVALLPRRKLGQSVAVIRAVDGPLHDILATVMVCDFKARRLSTAPRRLMRRGAEREARGNGRLAPGSLILAAGRSSLGRWEKNRKL